jgi:hypothetical protein
MGKMIVFSTPLGPVIAKFKKILTGVHGVVILLVFLGGPVAIGYMVGLGLFWISDSMRLLLAYFGLFIGVPTAANAMLYIADLNELTSVRVLWSMLSTTINTCKHVLIPSFLFLCLIILSVQLLPLAMLGLAQGAKNVAEIVQRIASASQTMIVKANRGTLTSCRRRAER